MSSGLRRALRVLLAALTALVLVCVGYLLVALGPHFAALDWQAVTRGYARILQPAEPRGAMLRTAQGGADRVYLLTTQSERIVPLRFGTGTPMEPYDQLHVDLWAFDPVAARPQWRRRLRSFTDRQPLSYELLGADRTTLWLFVREPLAVSLADGAVRADGARLDAVNASLAGKRVDQEGYVAFGAQGLQVTLSDSAQSVIDGETFIARPRAAAPRRDREMAVPGLAATRTDRFQYRGLPLVGRWIGVLADEEAAALQAPPVVPGAGADERRGGMADYLERTHVPGDLTVRPIPYRLWRATVAKVSAAPRDWPKELPDRWGTRDQFSAYAPLPESPAFLQAGLLGDGRGAIPYWLREPDSVLVLHHDKLGDAGRLRVTRIAGPGGRVVWEAALPLAALTSSTLDANALALFGSAPNPRHDPSSDLSRERHDLFVAVDLATGAVRSYDLTAESVADVEPR